ncbi:riboflavin kinase [Alistipes sp. OttesenSCG-928-B03]|nr:riboflavin kinase [Alistipes sp. OttesenSCG-928-B03]
MKQEINYTIKGEVVSGKKLGRRLGFPTANIMAGETPGVRDGVYAAQAEIDGQTYHGMANLGRKPSFPEDYAGRLLEVNFFGFSGDLYGRELEVSLLKYIRPEQEFETAAELQRMVAEDKHEIERFFKH